MHIHLLDTSIATDNIGDEIIVKAIKEILTEKFPTAYFTNSSSHDGMGKFGRQLAGDADLVFLLGTNALSPSYQGVKNGLWPLQRKDLQALAGKVVLFGVGAGRYFSRVSYRQSKLLSKILSRSYIHSVRDGTALSIIESLGLSVLNTGCPTLWGLTTRQVFEPRKINTVCFSLTHYRKSAEDRCFVESLFRRYDSLFFWPQQIKDIEYLQRLGALEDVQILSPNLASYEGFLQTTDCDVLGSRLHGGIHALKYGRRAVIIAVDNRARDIGRETCLPVIERGGDLIQDLDCVLSGNIVIDVSSQKSSGHKFMDQFSYFGGKQISWMKG